MEMRRAATYSEFNKVVALRGPMVVFLCSVGAVFSVSVLSLLFIATVATVKGFFYFIADIVLIFGELCAAIVAAVTSGVTVTLTVILAVLAASFTFPASSLRARILVSVAVSAAGITSASVAVIAFSSLSINLEIASAMISAAAVSVAFASAWAVGVMSLIEKETKQVGIRMTSLLDAVRRNNYTILKVLVKIQPSTRMEDLDLCLLHAVKAGYPQCIEVLLSAGANVNTRDGYDNTPLIIACETGNVSIVRRLLEAGAVVDGKNAGTSTALHQAAKWGYANCVQLLLQRGADPNIQDSLWRTPLMLAAKHAHQTEEVMRLLINAGADVNMKGSEQRSVLHYAASRGVGVKLLLQVGVDPHAQDTEGNTALHCSSTEGHEDVTLTLLQFKCDPNTTNYQKRTSIHLAAMNGHYRCITILLEAGCNMDMLDSAGNRPIWYSTLYNHTRTTVYLVHMNCYIGDYSNPLKAALFKNNLKLAKILLLSGCDKKPLLEWLSDFKTNSWSHERNPSCLSWIKNLGDNPDSLVCLSRIVIRKHIGKPIKQKVTSLPLPNKLKDIVLLTELDEICSNETT